MKLKLCKSDDMDDWYTIERAKHNHTLGMGMHPTAGCMMLMYSGRISDADVEGTAAEMRAIAEAIKARTKNDDARRCAVRVEGDRVFFWSPRNSTTDGECTLDEADELATQILSEVPGAP